MNVDGGLGLRLFEPKMSRLRRVFFSKQWIDLASTGKNGHASSYSFQSDKPESKRKPCTHLESRGSLVSRQLEFAPRSLRRRANGCLSVLVEVCN